MTNRRVCQRFRVNIVQWTSVYNKIKALNGKELWFKTLFKVFNADETKNREITRFALLELEINKEST